MASSHTIREFSEWPAAITVPNRIPAIFPSRSACTSWWAMKASAWAVIFVLAGRELAPEPSGSMMNVAMPSAATARA